MTFNSAYDAWKEAEEAENRAWQSDASREELQEAEANADAAYEAVADVVYGHGGPRPNSGGARPNSGALAGTIRSFHPFAWREKGDTISVAQFEFTRCNACGAIGWESLCPEMQWDASRPESEGWQAVASVPDKPLVHKPGCKLSAAP